MDAGTTPRGLQQDVVLDACESGLAARLALVYRMETRSDNFIQ
jgi:hypothetical protein